MTPRKISHIFSPVSFSNLVEYVTQALSGRLTFTENMDCRIVNVPTIEPGKTVRVIHGLQRMPSYRQILRQRGGFGLVDGAWGLNWAELENKGTEPITGLIVAYHKN